MTFQVPWVISDVNEVPLEVARLMAYAATGGKEGVIGPGDLQIRATATPGTSIRCAPGSFAALNRFPGNSQQTYLGQNDAEVTKAVTATGGASRSDLVYVRINDTGQTGGGTSGAATLEIAQGVSPTATKLSDYNANIAGVALARIDIPASTSTITQAYITDLRELVSPRRAELVRIANKPDGASNQNLTSTTFVSWPTEASWTVAIPSWAVRVNVLANIAGFLIVEGESNGANVYGRFRVMLGSTYTAAVDYNYSCPTGLGTQDAGASFVADTIYVPAAMRGTNQTLRFEAKRDGGQSAGDKLQTNWGTVVAIQLVFYEDPDDQWWA